ncbi:MAG: hypothetical protein PHS92_02755 [Candidatus Gracilibacteria bacterium]|nr:hypothetical protein [Candidatus Gracilibacteria bacterium]
MPIVIGGITGLLGGFYNISDKLMYNFYLNILIFLGFGFFIMYDRAKVVDIMKNSAFIGRFHYIIFILIGFIFGLYNKDESIFNFFILKNGEYGQGPI